MKLKQTGSVFLNHGLWYYSVQLPGEKKRRQVPLKAPGAKTTLREDRPRKMAEEAAARYWEEHTRQVKRHEAVGMRVSTLCAEWGKHCTEYYSKSMATNGILGVRLFCEMYANQSVCELTHADMLRHRDALVRSGVCRGTVNRRLWFVKAMIAWALDEGLIPAVVKAELSQVRNIKRGRSQAPERAPVRPVDDVTITETLKHMMPNTADMVRVHRLTGMRPCELCHLRWSQIDTSQTPWVYRVPADANKNAWRGELGRPRVVLIGPKAREILNRYRGGDIPFSPEKAMTEYFNNLREERVTPFYGGKDPNAHIPRKFGETWKTDSYTGTIAAACRRADIKPWGANRLRHAFATEVRRKFGLDAARAVLGHTGGGCVTDIYTYDSLEEEMIRRAAPAVEALG